MHITVIGCGYLGAVHAACLADDGFTVTGIDTDYDKVTSLNRATAPIHELGLGTLLNEHVAGIEGSTGRLAFTTDIAEAAHGDVHFLCVGTPQHADGSCDLSQLHAAVDALTPHLTRPCLVVGKSTVPVGTAKHLAHRITHLAPAGHHAELAWNPEFLRESAAVEDTLHPDRIVAGVNSPHAEKILREVYSRPIDDGSPFIVTDLPTAELVKSAANSFLATKISFINAMAEVCEATGGDVTQLAEALGHDDRIGHKFLHAGIGFGGGCLPKDIRAFMARAEDLGTPQSLRFLREMDHINTRARERMVNLASDAMGGLTGKHVAILGATFKPETDDVRDSPALDIADRLHQHGCHVTVHDPYGIPNARHSHPHLTYRARIPDTVHGADALLHLTEWSHYRNLDPSALAELTAQPVLLDGRGKLNPEPWRSAGWTVRSLGRPGD